MVPTSAILSKPATPSGSQNRRSGQHPINQPTPAAWEFYDLEIDPHEMRNLYGDPSHAATIARMKNQLVETRAALGETDASYPAIQRIIDAHWAD